MKGLRTAMIGLAAVAALTACAADAPSPGTSGIAEASSSSATSSIDDSSIDDSQSVIVSVGPPTRADDDLAVGDVEDAMSAAVEPLGGYVDGNEIGADGTATVYAYGPDADAMWEAMRPTLTTLLPPGSSALIQYSPGSPANHTISID